MVEPAPIFAEDDPFDTGLTAQMRGDFDAAIQCFIEVLKRDPKNAQAYLQLGKCEARRGDLRTAAEAFRRGIRVAPQSAPILAELGFLQLITGDRERAHKVLKGARRLSKRNVRALTGLAWFHVQRQAWSQALAATQELLEVSNSNFAAHFLMAQTQEALGSIAGAHQEWVLTEEICRKMINAAEGHGAAQYYLGEIMRITRGWAAGREYFEAAAEHAPGDGKGYLFGMGMAVPWSTVLAAAGTACAEDGDEARAQYWVERLPVEARDTQPPPSHPEVP